MASSSSARRKPSPYSQRPWYALSASEQETRVRVLEVLRYMREGRSLSAAAQQVGTDNRTVKAHLRGYLRKLHRRWRGRKRDHIERGLQIYESGRIRSVVINDSEMASIIGRHYNAVKKALASRDASDLKPYRKLVILDHKGKRHRLETNLQQLREIELQREDEFGVDIYAY